jgi:hypothetical protein
MEQAQEFMQRQALVSAALSLGIPESSVVLVSLTRKLDYMCKDEQIPRCVTVDWKLERLLTVE